MENKVLNENLNAIARYNSSLINKILTIDIEKSNITLTKTQSDEYNMALDGINIHNEISAIEESRLIAKGIVDEDNSIKIVYGLGLGYLIDEISNIASKSTIILYEPNIEILRFVFELATIDAIFKENVFVASSKEELEEILLKEGKQNAKISISFLNYHKKYFFDELKEIFEYAQRCIASKTAFSNTLKSRQVDALKYTFFNLKRIIKFPEINQFKDIYKGKTALIVSAGVSLSENIETIKKYQDKAVIFVVSQAVNTLAENDIKADFIVNIDACDNSSHFKNINPEEYDFIFETYCCNSIHAYKSHKTISYISENNFFNFWIRDLLNITGKLETIGTVSYTAFMSAYIMGFKKIILIGQDLSYKNGKCYCSGSVADNLECVLEDDKYIVKITDDEKLLKVMIKPNEAVADCKKRIEKYVAFLNKNLHTIKGQNGELLPTQAGYSLFVDYFEKTAKQIKEQNPEIELINSSLGGAQINGFENISLEEAFLNAENVEKINLKKFKANYDKNKIYKMLELLEMEFKKLQEVLDEFDNVNSKLLKELENKNIITSNAEKLIKKHLEIFQFLSNYEGSQIAQFIIYLRFLKCQKVVSTNYLSSVESLKEALKKIMIVSKYRSYGFYIERLAYCKSIIAKQIVNV